MSERRVRKALDPLAATFGAVPSKSVTHRALVVASLATGDSALVDPLDADDTRATRAGLGGLGLASAPSGREWRIRGAGGAVPGGGSLHLGDSGTTLRLLLAVAALGERPTELDGSARLRERPVQELARALGDVGADVALGASPGGLPVRAGGRSPRGGSVRLAAAQSSQFASALLLVGARLPDGLDLILEPPVVSLPYVELSVTVLSDFGVAVERRDELHWRVPAADYPSRTYRIEGDHSSAAFFLAAAAVVGGTVRVGGLDPGSRQPDARLGTILRDLGCVVRTGADWVEVEGSGEVPGFDLDLSDAPDLVPVMAILGLFATGRTSLRGVPHLRLKESNRLAVLAENLSRLGRRAETTDDALVIGPPPRSRLRGGPIATASDHRIAMAFAIAGLRLDGIVIDDLDCVSKSNPRFWEDFEALERGVRG